MAKEKKQVEKCLFLDDPAIYSSKRVTRDRNDVRTFLFHSRLDQGVRTERHGKLVVKSLDDGNGVDIIFPETGPSFRLDYSQFVELRMLLSAHAWNTFKKMKVTV